MKTRKCFSLMPVLAFAIPLTLGVNLVAAADYPEKAIHLVVPFKAGGGTDNIARGIAKALEEVAGVSIVVDNVTGAGGIKGILHALKSKPDGYTVLMDGSADITAPLTFKDLPFSLDDFTYVGAFFTSPTYILSHKDRKLTSLEELLKRAKANPGKLTVGTAGPQGAQMIMASAIKGITGADFRIIPYSGGADLKKALAGNQVDAGIIHAPVMLSAVKGGEINVIGTGLPLTKINYPPIRGTKTLKELGINIEIGITRGLLVPKGTPPDVVAKLRKIARRAAKGQTFKKFGDTYGFPPVWLDHGQFEKLIRDELAMNKEIKAKYIDKK
ncbi:MAG: Bug family tripartite tricarboxylate transporter substrate binding protein [Acidiferrobacterales bacterium]